MDVRELLKAVMAQNAALKKEVGELRKEIKEAKSVKESKGKVRVDAIEDAPKPPTSTPPPSPPKDPPPCTPVKGRADESNQAWAGLRIPDFPKSVEGENMGKGLAPRGSGVPEVPGSWGAGGWGLQGGHQRVPDREGRGGSEENRELIRGSPLEQAAQSVLRQLGTSSPEGQWATPSRSSRR